ncbi:MAG: SUMF1/EgtB/PvdO family nonheme iron enzyme, partial [Myxococcales bacterium]|nr:SUMF1/EgtB/PvdO family nonheme iron enzyme [Myxococcales bacterium]
DATDTTGDGDPNPEVPMVGAAFLIDAHEVRVRDYLKFVADPDGPPPLPAGCEWKTSHIPDQWPDQLGENLDYPVRRIDWCDAWAYCAWAGKHLCGLVGGEPASLEQIVDPIANEWYRACTNDSSLVPYPYGETYDPVRCNGEDGVADLLPVGAEGPCEGGYAFLFDMSGNVWEWTNACADGAPPEGDEALRECRRR